MIDLFVHNHSVQPLSISLIDDRSGIQLLNIHLQYITPDQVNLLMEQLEDLLNELKYSTQTLYEILTRSINEINWVMTETEGNTIFCTLDEHFQLRNIGEMNSILPTFNRNTMDIEVSFWIPENIAMQPSLQRYVSYFRNQYIIRIHLQGDAPQNMQHILSQTESLST